MIKIINYNGYDFTTIDYKGEILFWGKEICKYLEYSEKTKIADIMKVHTDEDERIMLKNKDIKEIQSRFKNDSKNNIKLNNRGEYFVAELGVYGLILGSEKSEAKQFKKWVKQTIKQLRKQVGLDAYEVFRMMDKNVQKQCASFIAENGNIGERTDNIVMNKNVNALTSKMYQINPPIRKGEMEKYYPEMLTDRQKILSDYCTLFGYTQSHKQTRSMISEKMN